MGGSFKGKNALLAGVPEGVPGHVGAPARVLHGVLVTSGAALIAAALWPLPWAFAIVLLVSYGAESTAGFTARLPTRFTAGFAARFSARFTAGFAARFPAPRAAARTAKRGSTDGRATPHLGVTLRFLTREIAAVLLLARTLGAGSRWFVLLAGGLFLFHGVRAVQIELSGRLNRCHTRRPITTRNLDLPALDIPPAHPRNLINWCGARMLYLDVLPVGLTTLAVLGTLGALPTLGDVLPALGGVPADPERLGVYGLAVALALQLAATAALAIQVRRAADPMDRRHVIEAVQEQVCAYRPEVLLYFSGPADSAYQATMWLGVLERIGRRPIVVLRERELLAALGKTTLPVICVPSAVDLMNLQGLETARVALFASNVGNNIHMLRVPGVRSVFIGHGDSDKEASFNPFTKVYDEVWVAGPAGRDRYRRTQVGVREEAIVEVGRPQLAVVLPTGPGLPYPTVLYAPTWEGWTDDLFHTSIEAMGPALVRALLKQPIRLIYKPHPLTGHRSPAARDAHREIMAMLHEAGRVDAARAGAGFGVRVGIDDHGFPAGSASGGKTVAGMLRMAGAAETVIRHRAVTGAEPHLYDCFNQADLLIGDISSVVTDFVASGKPYVITNVAGLPPAEFRRRYPTAEAAYPLSPDLHELPEIMYQLGQGEDLLAGARRELRAYVLGPDHPDALTRFDDAVNAACARAALNDRLQAASSAPVEAPA